MIKISVLLFIVVIMQFYDIIDEGVKIDYRMYQSLWIEVECDILCNLHSLIEHCIYFFAL